MDKLRAIQYMNLAVESGSFAAAARSLDVSTPAVAQLVRALERSLGVELFHRTTRGLSLTADGERYYESSRKITADLHDLEQSIGPRGAKPRGTLTVGMVAGLGHCVMRRVTRFLARFPDIAVVTKRLRTFQDVAAANVDVAVLMGWPPAGDFIVRQLAQTRYVVCGSPEYWAREGRPHYPDELRTHHCLILSGVSGVRLDRWLFERDGERRTIDVKSRLIGDDRPWLEEAACAGAGIVRFVDLTIGHYLSSGALVPTLTDWNILEAPPIYAIYRRSHRNSNVVRVFIDFLVEMLAELEKGRASTLTSGAPRVPKPEWYGRAHGRQSAYVGRQRKGR